MSFEKRNFMVEDVELNWAKLDPSRPVSPFNVEQWELQIATTDKKVAKHLSENHLAVKEKDGKYIVSLKRKARKADGSANKPVRVVDGKLEPVDPTIIGNGSRGNVQLFQYPYDTRGNKGVATQLNAVQIVELVKYEPTGSGFSVIDTDDSSDDSEAALMF